MRALFVAHDTSVYGSSQSLQLLLRNYNNVEIDLLIRKRLLKKNDFSKVRKLFGKNINKIYEFFLPVDPCYDGRPKNFLQVYQERCRNLLWRLNRKKLYTFLKKKRYDFIHLNSISLNPLIARKLPFIIHVRETFNGESYNTINRINNAAGIIFISEPVKESLGSVDVKNTVILTNPFDMTSVDRWKNHDFQQELGVDICKKVVYSLIGRISETKGTAFITNTFSEIENDGIVLLIVGSGKKCQPTAKTDNRIRLLGEIEDIAKIYCISDYILRGEKYFSIGRTMYEGLYAGCGVVIPGTYEDLQSIEDHDKFKDKIFFYKPRDKHSLINALKKTSKHKITKKVVDSNVEDYVQKFNAFVQQIVHSQSQR